MTMLLVLALTVATSTTVSSPESAACQRYAALTALYDPPGNVLELLVKGGCAATIMDYVARKGDSTLYIDARRAAEDLRRIVNEENESFAQTPTFRGFKAFAQALKLRCEKDGPPSKSCAARTQLMAMADGIHAKLKAEEAAEARNRKDGREAAQASREAVKTGGDLVERVCEALEKIRLAKATMERERKIGQTSGVVDKAVLHQKGARIVDAESEIQKAKAAYHDRFGRPLNMDHWSCE